MKTTKALTLALCLIILICSLPLQSSAASNDITLTVHYIDGSNYISDAIFDVYLIATADDDGNCVPTDSFKNYPVEFSAGTDEEMYNLATTLEGYVLKDKIKPMHSAHTDGNGDFVFTTKSEKDKRGLYLIIGHPLSKGNIIYTAEAFAIYLPGIGDEEQNLYEITVKAKYSTAHKDAPKTHRKIFKIWDDDSATDKRPADVHVTLLKNGEVYDRIVLSKDNGWSYEWFNLDATARWNIVETEVGDYTVVLTKEGTNYYLKNTYTETPPPPPDLPQTGQLWWPVPIFAILGIAFITVGVLIYNRKKSIEN